MLKRKSVHIILNLLCLLDTNGKLKSEQNTEYKNSEQQIEFAIIEIYYVLFKIFVVIKFCGFCKIQFQENIKFVGYNLIKLIFWKSMHFGNEHYTSLINSKTKSVKIDIKLKLMEPQYR